MTGRPARPFVFLDIRCALSALADDLQPGEEERDLDLGVLGGV
jgi:hypothetical protein